MAAAKLVVQTYRITLQGQVLTDPDASGDDYVVTTLTRPDGGGATIESFAEADHTRKSTGIFSVPLTDGSYTDGTWYESVTAWTKDGRTMTLPARKFYYVSPASGHATPDAPTLSALINDGTGTSITARVAPASGYETYPIRLLYHTYGGANQDGGARTGAGTKQITGLSDDTAYCVVAQHEHPTHTNVKSYPSSAMWLVCHDATRLGSTVVDGIVAALRQDSTLAEYAPNWAKADARKHVFGTMEDGWVGGRGPGRCPFVEVAWDGGDWPARNTGEHNGLDFDMPFRLRCTVAPATDIDAFVADVRRSLQTDANRYLGDAAHVVGVTIRMGVLEESFAIRRRELSLAVRMVATPGVNG